MADYPFRVNMMTKNGEGTIAFYTSSLADDGAGDAVLTAAEMVEKINLMPSSSYEDGVVSGSSTAFVHKFGGGRNLHLSCSVSAPTTGSIIFQDKESVTNGGLDYYTFWGTKVCSVLGLPEGIPIYTENFKLSDDSDNPSNYLSGDVIADGIAIKNTFKLSPQARVKSNLIWDEENGEGLAQWVSGSTTQASIGYDDQNDRYKLNIATASIGRLEVDSGASGTSDVFFRGITGTGNKEYWIPQMFMSGFNYGSAGGTQVVVPFTSVQEQTSTTNTMEYSNIIMPFDAMVMSVSVRASDAGGGTFINMFKLTDGTEGVTLGGGSATEGDAFGLIDIAADDTVYSVGFSQITSGGRFVSKGEAVLFTFDPTSDTNDTRLTVLFMVNPFSIG